MLRRSRSRMSPRQDAERPILLEHRSGMCRIGDPDLLRFMSCAFFPRCRRDCSLRCVPFVPLECDTYSFCHYSFIRSLNCCLLLVLACRPNKSKFEFFEPLFASGLEGASWGQRAFASSSARGPPCSSTFALVLKEPSGLTSFVVLSIYSETANLFSCFKRPAGARVPHNNSRRGKTPPTLKRTRLPTKTR